MTFWNPFPALTGAIRDKVYGEDLRETAIAERIKARREVMDCDHYIRKQVFTRFMSRKRDEALREWLDQDETDYPQTKSTP